MQIEHTPRTLQDHIRLQKHSTSAQELANNEFDWTSHDVSLSPFEYSFARALSADGPSLSRLERIGSMKPSCRAMNP
jgi:hypothetical protein